MHSKKGDSGPSRGLRFGYLVPEFPGQTHSFFWREIEALRKLGVEPVLLSTRLPDSRLIAHTWASRAISETIYLYPLTWRQALKCTWRVVAAGPSAWSRLARGVIAGGPSRWLKSLALVVLGARLAEISRDEDICHIHVHSSADAAFIAAFAVGMAPISYSIVLHGALSCYGPGQVFKWQGAAFGLVVSGHLQQELLTLLGAAHQKKISVAPMGVDLCKFRRHIPYVPWSAGVGPLKILSCGRLNFGKGHQDVIEALVLLRRQGVSAILKICGEDDDGGDGYGLTLRRQVSDMGLEKEVVFLGAVDEAVLCRELADAHLFVLASHMEAIGVAYMEAMAMEMPVIGSMVGGVPELITNGQDGMLVQPSDPAALAKAIKKVADDAALAKRMSLGARATVVQRFGSERSALAVIAGVERAIGQV